MDVVKNFRDVQGGKTTFVRFENVTKFLIACAAAGITVCGGAFAHDMSGQRRKQLWLSK